MAHAYRGLDWRRRLLTRIGFTLAFAAAANKGGRDLTFIAVPYVLIICTRIHETQDAVKMPLFWYMIVQSEVQRASGLTAAKWTNSKGIDDVNSSWWSPNKRNESQSSAFIGELNASPGVLGWSFEDTTYIKSPEDIYPWVSYVEIVMKECGKLISIFNYYLFPSSIELHQSLSGKERTIASSLKHRMMFLFLSTMLLSFAISIRRVVVSMTL